MSGLLTKYDRAGERVRQLREKVGEAKAVYEAAKVELDEAVADQQSLRDKVSAALNAPVATAPTAVPVAVPKRKQSAVSVPPALQELIDGFPLNDTIKKADLGKALGLKDTVVHTRLQKAKKAGLVESAGWGVYQLSDDGKKARGTKLQAVP